MWQSFRASGFVAIVLLGLLSTAAHAKASADVQAAQQPDQIILDNGLLRAVVSTRLGQIVSLRKRDGGHDEELVAQGQSLYWDANGETVPAAEGAPKSGYFRPEEREGRARLVRATPELAEVAARFEPTPFFPFSGEYHYVMRRGLSGVYAYVVLRHGADQPAARLYQTRFVLRTAADDRVFNQWTLSPDLLVPIPRANVVNTLTDATFLLADGSVKTKYLNSVYWDQVPVYGTLGVFPSYARGVWMIEPSGDYHNGGPIRQGQTVHDDVLLRVLQDVHFGASPVALASGEAWAKVYGPFLVYANEGPDVAALWADAHRQLNEERKAWPYDFVRVAEFASIRGQVSGTVTLNGKPPVGARVILSDPDASVDWTAQNRAYSYWAEVGPDGCFHLDKVAPGRYTLYVDGADQPSNLRHEGVEVRAGRDTKVGTLHWTPETLGQVLWQLGRFDRTAAEFRNGRDARDYQMVLRYAQQFPYDVDLTIGQGDPAQDWNYAHWSWYVAQPQWHLRFAAKAQAGRAALTIGVASAQPAHGPLTQVQVALNGHPLGRIELPKTGTAGYRGGTQDSPYHVLRFPFDAAWIKDGLNDLTLEHLDAERFPALGDAAHPVLKRNPGQVMYDALRLEVEQ
ncbi:rhamnogalacturonan endolyase [Roseateles sp. YR242]|uniref:polysaccharide lyase family protein n=1 Tax=Roseateles sp. YR242 TaxID=1855305 RepID=UPI0008B7F061|nr:polysaccharide lyase family protein [Roseateles sp. YR242]SEL39952.1 rhamnogalacturonan endolyase [Roseateles sp. YR242]